MREDAPELGPIAFHFHEGAAELAFLRALCECLLEQTTEPVLLPLNPEDVLNFLSGTRARNRGVQEHAPHDLVACEPARACEVLQVSRVRIGQPHGDSMVEIPHLTSIGIAIVLSRRNRCSERANKPKALSASTSAERERNEVRATRLQFCWQTKLQLARTESGSF